MDWLLIGPVIATFAIPLAFSWILTACHIRVARDFGLIDFPSERKFHKNPTPTGAGVALYLAVFLVAFLDGLCNSQFLLGGLIVLAGLFDDRRPLSWQPRLLIHALIAFAAARSALSAAPWPWQVVGALWIIVLINAMNFVDNMDGLCTGIAWIIAVCLALVEAGTLGSEHFVFGTRYEPFGPPKATLGFIHLLMLTGALTGFLWYNRPPARVFMGDAGSTFLGFFLGVASLPLFFDGEESAHFSDDWLAPLCMMALPIYDLISVAVLRVWHRRGLFISDRNNLSHRLVELGLSPTRAVLLLWLMALASGAGGLLLYVVPLPAKTIVGAAQLAGWWGALPIVEFVAHRRRVY